MSERLRGVMRGLSAASDGAFGNVVLSHCAPRLWRSSLSEGRRHREPDPGLRTPARGGAAER
ncbi:hypothetical protein JCM13591A_24860 [Microbacterium xylanilyticum]